MYDINEANLSKGKAKPFIVLGALAVVAAIGIGLLSVGYEADAKRMTPDQGAIEKKRILVLPIQEQIAEFRKYASSDISPYLKEEALKRLAWAKDPAGVDLAIKALKDPTQKIRSQAALALTEYGSPAADAAKPALLQALKEAGPESRPQIAWALAVLKESSAFPDIMKLYRAGELATVQRLGGGLAFDPNMLVDLVSLDQLAAMYKDESPAVRQLVATVLSRKADPKYTDQLIALVKDPDKSVAHQAAAGLGKIGDARAREPLVAALKGQPADERKEYLEALRNGVGTKGLVLALDTVGDDDPTREWHQREQIWRHIDELNDPSGADALADLLNKDLHPHWSYRVGRALASVGDMRGVAPLVKRLRQKTEKIYSDETDQEQLLKRNNNETVEAARLLADLAVIHPDKLDELREQSEHAIWSWMNSLPMPHANGLRALTRMKSTLHKAKLREWADPNEPLPLEGQQPPMPDAWVIAQSALRYLGMQADPADFKILTKQLKRKDPDLDITMGALQGGGIAILGMSLRAIEVGASQGISEWRNPEGFEPLMKFIEDEKENDQARQHACAALAWVADDDGMVKVAEKIQEYSGDSPADQFRRACYLETLVQRPIPGTASALLPLLKPEAEFETRHQVARALGKSGLTPDVEAKLFDLLKDQSLQLDAALALMLGGTSDTAARALASLADDPPEALLELQEMWYKSFGYWSIQDLEEGHIFRFVDNAVAASRVEIRDASQDWVTAQLMRQFDNLLYDNGPHSFTRVVLRAKLMDMAQGNDAEKRAGAIRTLKFMGEQGVLLTLRDAPGETGKLASIAYHELTNPKVQEGLVKNFKEEE
jgi:HEAT repeat protein